MSETTLDWWKNSGRHRRLNWKPFSLTLQLQESSTRGQGIIRPKSHQYCSVLHVLVGGYRIQQFFTVSPARWTAWSVGRAQKRLWLYFPYAWMINMAWFAFAYDRIAYNYSRLFLSTWMCLWDYYWALIYFRLLFSFFQVLEFYFSLLWLDLISTPGSRSGTWTWIIVY